VSCGKAAGGAGVAKTRSDDEDSPLATNSQKPLEVCHRGRHGDLVHHHQLAYHGILAVLLGLGDGGEDPVLTLSLVAALYQQ
jgi:hypothetical protein